MIFQDENTYLKKYIGRKVHAFYLYESCQDPDIL